MKMQKSVTAILVVLVLLAAVRVKAESLPNPANVSFKEALRYLNNPKSVNKWLVKNFAYDFAKNKEMKNKRVGYEHVKKSCFKEQSSKWNHKSVISWISTPEEFYRNQKGLCFDVANFAAYCLHKAGYEAQVLGAVFKRRTKHGSKVHAACAYKEDDKWFIIADARDGRNLGVRNRINMWTLYL